MYDALQKRLLSVRLDSITKVKKESTCSDYDTYRRYYESNRKYLWGTSFGDNRCYGQTEHIHMEIEVDEAKEQFVIQRLVRECRNGVVKKISDGKYSFDADLFDANEASPWVKTFMGRITAFESTNKELQEKFYNDIRRLGDIYGGNRQ